MTAPKTSTLVARIRYIERIRGSVNGNPRFALTVEMPGDPERTGDAWRPPLVIKTEPDSGLAYGIENPEYVGTRHEPGPWLTLTLNGRGNLIAATVNTEPKGI